MSDKMKRRTLIVCAGVLVLCGLPMVVMAVVQRDARMGLYGVMSLLFALSNSAATVPRRRLLGSAVGP